MLDTKLKLKLYDLLVIKCEEDLKEQALLLYREIVSTIESEQENFIKKIEETTKEIEEVLNNT